jgi:uncharacterized membrane protein HdeD (DUF308 family)
MEERVLDKRFLGLSPGWMLAGGVITVVLGVIAFRSPVASSLGVTIAIGALLLADGVVRLVHAIRERRHQTGSSRFFLAIVSIIAGGLVLFYPGAGLLGVAVALSFYFFATAGSQWVLASAMGPNSGRGWVIASSIASFALGVYIIANFPLSALWVPGMLLGIELVIMGASMIGVSFRLRRFEKGVEEIHERIEKPPEERRAA